MNTNESNSLKKTKVLVGMAIFTALVVVLQLLAGSIKIGTFSPSLVLIPIVIGAATCGVKVGVWLGFVFGVVVLLSGDAAAFLAVNIPGTVITVLVKGAACGLMAGLIYRALEKYNRYAAVAAAAIVCPLVNTGVFLLGCALFFLDTIRSWGAAAGFEGSLQYMLLGLVGGNFLFELGSNIVLSPVIVRLLNLGKRK